MEKTDKYYPPRVNLPARLEAMEAMMEAELSKNKQVIRRRATVMGDTFRSVSKGSLARFQRAFGVSPRPSRRRLAQPYRQDQVTGDKLADFADLEDLALAVFHGGVETSIRAHVWLLLLQVVPFRTSRFDVDILLAKQRARYDSLRQEYASEVDAMIQQNSRLSALEPAAAGAAALYAALCRRVQAARDSGGSGGGGYTGVDDDSAITSAYDDDIRVADAVGAPVLPGLASCLAMVLSGVEADVYTCYGAAMDATPSVDEDTLLSALLDVLESLHGEARALHGALVKSQRARTWLRGDLAGVFFRVPDARPNEIAVWEACIAARHLGMNALAFRVFLTAAMIEQAIELLRALSWRDWMARHKFDDFLSEYVVGSLSLRTTLLRTEAVWYRVRAGRVSWTAQEHLRRLGLRREDDS